jgi:hypothetical protein
MQCVLTGLGTKRKVSVQKFKSNMVLIRAQGERNQTNGYIW